MEKEVALDDIWNRMPAQQRQHLHRCDAGKLAFDLVRIRRSRFFPEQAQQNSPVGTMPLAGQSKRPVELSFDSRRTL